MLGLALLYVGAVLFVNGMWLLGKAEDREVGIMNLFTGVLTFLIAMYTAFTSTGQIPLILAAGQTLLFSFTYLWVALNNFFHLGDGRGLGWYCLFVAVSTVPSSLITFQAGDGRFGVIWLVWGALWFVYFLVLALKRNLGVFTGWATALVGITTCWVPGYLILLGRWG
jgi:putative amide transporter protein